MTPEAGRVVAGGRREELRRRLQDLGFDEVRFAAAEPAAGGSLAAWLEAGHHADMGWLERSAGKRADAGRVLPGVRSVIILGVNYWTRAAPGEPRWARYALYEDYHDTVKAGLEAAGRLLEAEHGAAPVDHRYYVDTGPVLERGWAARSGLGFRGKNAMLISRRHGNWLFLAAILTRLAIEPDAPLRRTAAPGGEEPAGLLCGKCTRCLDACPTAAFPRPGVVDARRCISYQTIENRGVIPAELRPGIGSRIYGCDACLEVCPWNRFAQEGRRLLLAARPELAALTTAELLALTPARFAERFRRTAIKRLKLAGLLRNACVVAGNSGDRSLLPALAALARHESPVVRAHAVWAVRRLEGDTAAGERLAEARTAETDPRVLAEYGQRRSPAGG
ncbi:MAG: tRNA epoxyqueuosine(34) reductase QueG [Opitutaceae bacterium]|nr:tRNA epoxyqueuosine(34) reductase QueG [Opitutaceae bacterium]